MKRVDPLVERDIEAGGTVVVPSGPRAAALEAAHAHAQLESGRGAWRTPDVIAYRAWLEREAYRAAEAGHIASRPLRAAEEWLLWRETVAAEAAAQDVPAAASRLADSLRRAARLLHDWDISPAALRSSTRAECRLLFRALAAFEDRARKLGAVGSHRLAGLLKSWRPARPVTFAGFTETTAAHRALIRAWSDGSGRCREHTGSDEHVELGALAAERQLFRVRAEDPSQELELAAEWCESGLRCAPGARMLVVLPDLAQRRVEALRVFRRVLAPRALLCDAGASGGEHGDIVVVEGGTPLTDEPLVRHALTSLEFLAGRAEAADVSVWLRAAFWTAPTAVERSELDAALREVLDVDVTPAALLAALRRVHGPLGPAADRLSAAVEIALGALQGAGEIDPARALVRAGDADTAPRIVSSSEGLADLPAAPLREWARRIDRALHALGWPGARPASPREEQAQTRFAEVMRDAAQIGSHVGSVAAGEALRILRALAERRTVSSPEDAPVTLTSRAADPIVSYGGIWMAGMHADGWPPPAQLDPFIPFAAQRRAGIAAADASRSLAQAREVLRRSWRACARFVASWPARAEQREYVPSPLLAEIPGIGEPRESAASRVDSLARRIRASRRIEPFEDRTGDPWPARSSLPSGTRAIEYQSRCPFRAYAELRLACVPLGAPRPGIGALERGRLLHRALELLWGRLGGSQGLEAASRGGALAPLIDECVSRALEETLPVTREPAARAARSREARRATQLCAELAELERQRAPFRVRSTELRRAVEIEGATLDVRIDRLDDLEDGSCAVFDYKTGRAASIDWHAERSANPQLLVYALAAGAPVGALAMIQLTPRRVAYRGLAQRGDCLPKVGAPPDPSRWPEHLARWRETVGRIAREFLRGEAAADPLGAACETCHLHGFCRIGDAAADDASAADTGAADAGLDAGGADAADRA